MRAVIFGAGSIGRRHLRNLASLGVGELFVVDPDDTRRASLDVPVAGHSARAEDAWAWGPSLAIVASPSHLHVAQASEAAAHGCHLFIEKPVGVAGDPLEDLRQAAASRALVTMVGCNMRFHPGPSAVKRLIEEGAVGRVLSARVETRSYLPDWRPGTDYRAAYSASAAMGGGVLLDCIHEIDLALWYLGPAALRAAVLQPAAAIGLDVEGIAELLLEHAAGAVSSVHLNFVQRDYRRGCQIAGESGTIYWDFATPEVTVHRGHGSVERIALDPAWDVNAMYVEEMRHFLAAVDARRETMCPIEAGMRALGIALAAREGQAA